MGLGELVEGPDGGEFEDGSVGGHEELEDYFIGGKEGVMGICIWMRGVKKKKRERGK